jgi:anti-sigma B factor antagonist
MAEQHPRMSISQEGEVTMVTLADQKILDEMNISQIGSKLGDIVVKTQKPQMVIDFGNVTNMSSSALGMLITLHKRVRERDGELRLCSIQPNIEEVFRITRLNEIFEICKSRNEALESLGQ